MTIKKISKIKEYKSFRDFSWRRFLNAENFHTKTNILYGENGSGKSSICNILKSVSQNKSFARYIPEEAELLIDNTQYKYGNQTWAGYIQQDSILFFDREFVDQNIHLGRSRGTQQGEQEQKSGKLIIEFDAEAINLRAARDKLAAIKEEKNGKLEDYQSNNRAALGFNLAEDEEKLFRKYKNKSNNAINNTKESLDNQRIDLDGKIKADKQLLQKTENIQAIEELGNIDDDLIFSNIKAYQGLFDFDLKEQVRIDAEEELVEKIKNYKVFFEEGFEIRKRHSQQCPFCQSKNQEENISTIISIYDRLYDDTYKKQKATFNKNKQTLIDELEQIQETVKNFDFNHIFIFLKKLAEQFSIKNIYLVAEEEQFRKPVQAQKIGELKKKISELDKPSKEDISTLYAEAKKEVENIIKLFSDIKRSIDKKNKLIGIFKKEHTGQKLSVRIGKNQKTAEAIKQELDFINGRKIESQKLKLEKGKELNKLTRMTEKAKAEHKLVKEKYEEYCSSGAFTKILKKIESYFGNFNFSFKLQLATADRHTGSTKELPFAFKVVDFDGNERDLREGLSEGEIQVLSLCFFFAFLDIHKNKNQKILVFDDPITSLDDSNLSSLVDFIASEKDKFSQTFILTHHRTFFKFLRKKFNKKCNEYNIIRNKNHLGGSFICKSKEERFIQKLKDFDAHLLQIAQNHSGFDVELKIVEYGQYLRYETEHFIKCRLLHWDVSNEFAKIVEGIKDNKKILDSDLDEIKQVYSFCNWTTSHVDIGDDHGLAQLKDKISTFTTIYDKTNRP